MGLSFNTDKNARYNERGVTPAVSTGSKEKASSVTKSAVAKGTITITDKEKQKQDITSLNRDTKNSLNQLGEIFDKTKVEERQELAGLFGKIAFNHLHDAKLTPNQRSAWHALIGGVMGELSNKDFLGGATAAGINEMLIRHIEKASNGNPATMQWMSAAIGGITGELISQNPQLGAAAASSGTKNNDLDEEMAAINNSNFKESVNQVANQIWNLLTEEDKAKLRKLIEEHAVVDGINLLTKYTIKHYPQIVKDYPMVFEGVRDLGRLRSASSFAGFIWFYYSTRYENRPDSTNYNDWLKQEIDGGQKD